MSLPANGHAAPLLVGPTMGRLYPLGNTKRLTQNRHRRAERLLRSVELRDGAADPATPGKKLRWWLDELENCSAAARGGKLWRKRVVALLQNPNMPLDVLRDVRGLPADDGSVRAWSDEMTALRDAVLKNPAWSLAGLTDPDVLLEPQRTRARECKSARVLRALLDSDDATTRRLALNNEHLSRLVLEATLRAEPWEQLDRLLSLDGGRYSFAAVRGRDVLLLRAIGEGEPARIGSLAWCAESCGKRAFGAAADWIVRLQGMAALAETIKAAPASQVRAIMQGSAVPEPTRHAAAMLSAAIFHNPLVPPEHIVGQARNVADASSAGVCDDEERRYWASLLADNPSAPPRALRICWFMGEKDALRKQQFPRDLARMLVLHAPHAARQGLYNMSTLRLPGMRRGIVRLGPEAEYRRSSRPAPALLPWRRQSATPPRWGRVLEGYVVWALPDRSPPIRAARASIVLDMQQELAMVVARRAAGEAGGGLTRFDWPFVSRFQKKPGGRALHAVQ